MRHHRKSRRVSDFCRFWSRIECGLTVQLSRPKMSLFEFKKRKSISHKKWREKNQDRILVRRRTYYQETRDHQIVKARIWSENHPGKVANRAKVWRENNPLYDTIRYRRNPEKELARTRVRIERIRHISPIGIILNKRFKNSALHHTGVEMDGGFVGIYIPKFMNVGHCAQLGKERNLEKVNYDALEFLAKEIESK